MNVITEIIRTHTTPFSRWEGRYQDGRYFYLRLRYGHYMMRSGKTKDKARGAEPQKVMFEGFDPHNATTGDPIVAAFVEPLSVDPSRPRKPGSVILYDHELRQLATLLGHDLYSRDQETGRTLHAYHMIQSTH